MTVLNLPDFFLNILILDVGDTMPIVEREDWKPTAFDYQLREHYRTLKRQKWEDRQNAPYEEEKGGYWTSDLFDMHNAETPFAEFGSIFMEKDEFDPSDEEY